MDQAWWGWRQFSDELNAAVTGPVSVGFLCMCMCEGTGLCPHLFLLALINSSRKPLPHWIMLQETCYSVLGKSLTIDFACVVSQAVHILNTYEIGPRINLWYSIPLPFNFIAPDLVVFKIIAFRITSNFWDTHSLSLSLYIYIYIYIYSIHGL